MASLDKILDLLDWSNCSDEQKKGLELAKDYNNIRCFLQPCNKKYNKNVWNNCAIVLSQKTDEELSPYLIELLEWLQDMNWPGAFHIRDRLIKYSNDVSFQTAINTCLARSQLINDEVWENNLNQLIAYKGSTNTEAPGKT